MYRCHSALYPRPEGRGLTAGLIKRNILFDTISSAIKGTERDIYGACLHDEENLNLIVAEVLVAIGSAGGLSEYANTEVVEHDGNVSIVFQKGSDHVALVLTEQGQWKARAWKTGSEWSQVHIGKISTLKEAVEASVRSINEDADGWRDISDAQKDGKTIIWAIFRSDISEQEGREDLEHWNGVQLPLIHRGLGEDGFDVGWGVAAPVGHGGFPDKWIAGWRPMPKFQQGSGT